MNQGNHFPQTIEELARFLEIEPGLMLYLTRNSNQYYKRGEREKPDGRIREFYKPHGELKKLQKKIHRLILKKLPLHESIHSYRKKRDQITNALPHVGKAYLIKLDIKDFFPSVTPTMVHTTFLKLGFSDSIARTLVTLTTYRNQLPQGTSTSPIIADLILFPLVRRFENLFMQHDATFTVFGDDITVSGAKNILKLKNLFVRIIEDEGFTLHPDKIQICRPKDKKKVTGVIVNVKPNIDKVYYRNLKAQIHNYRVKGPETKFAGDLQKIKRSLLGKINHVKRLNLLKGQRLFEEFKLINWGL